MEKEFINPLNVLTIKYRGELLLTSPLSIIFGVFVYLLNSSARASITSSGPSTGIVICIDCIVS